MAPELWSPKFGKIVSKYTPKIDIWSCGLIFLQLWMEGRIQSVIQCLEPTHEDQTLVHLVKETMEAMVEEQEVRELLAVMLVVEETRPTASALLMHPSLVNWKQYSQ
jgi:hypothetical protein